MKERDVFRSLGLGALLALMPLLVCALEVRAAVAAPPAEPARLMKLGPGDSVAIHVYGQPDMDATEYVADDGTIRVALAGAVSVNGLSPAEAGQRVERALQDGKYLVNPHVTITVAQSRSQRVSVLGEVRTPGIYNIESNTTVFDVLAQAGGGTENCADVVYVLRPDNRGAVVRYVIDLRALSGGAAGSNASALRAGDSVFVPRADRFYIYGEVQQPNMYKLEQGMTVVQAIARAGGVTPRGSERRIELRRRGDDGVTVIIHAKPTDFVRADDVIRVKESFF
jgi:polysaccharide export outer membrane protein